MEKGSFQAPFAELGELDFKETQVTSPQARPSVFVKTGESSNVRSSTVESLLSQNEDLMARLKVAHRRLGSLESENEALSKQRSDLTAQITNLDDQLMVWKEKENFWVSKNNQLENQLLQIRSRFPELEQMEEKIERYKKYHEKVKTQVKPYIQQLKNYAQSLVLEIRNLNKEIEIKEVRRLDIEKKIHDFKLEVEIQHQRQSARTEQLIEIFENEKSQLNTQIQELQKINTSLEDRTQRLDQALSRQDELENLVVSLRRRLEENSTQSQSIAKVRDEQLLALRSQLIEKNLGYEDSEKKRQGAEQELERQQHRAAQLTEQLASLRFMWTNQCEEVEKLKISLQSLEKLNLDLSQRLNQARRGEPNL